MGFLTSLLDKLPRGTAGQGAMTQPDYKLIYFNRRARGEVSRMIMAYAGFKYEDKRVTDEEFHLMYKHKMPFGQLPVLEVDGVWIAQSHAIERFLAKKAGLMGKTDIEEAKVNMIVDGLTDYTHVLNRMYTERDPEKRKAIRKEVEKELIIHRQKLDNLVEGDKNFVGSQMTLADISAAHVLDGPPQVRLEINWNDHPKLKAVRESVYTHPKIAEYLANRPDPKTP